MTDNSHRWTINQPQFTLMMRELEFGPSTVAEIVDQLRISQRAAYRLIHAAHRLGWVHIGGWEQRRGDPAAIWAIGPGADKRRPKPTPGARAKKRYRSKPGVLEREAAYARARRRLIKEGTWQMQKSAASQSAEKA